MPPPAYPRLTVDDPFENNLRSQTVSQQLPRTSIEGEDSILPPQTPGRFPSSHEVEPPPLSDSEGSDVDYDQPNVDEVDEDNQLPTFTQPGTPAILRKPAKNDEMNLGFLLNWEEPEPGQFRVNDPDIPIKDGFQDLLFNTHTKFVNFTISHPKPTFFIIQRLFKRFKKLEDIYDQTVIRLVEKSSQSRDRALKINKAIQLLKNVRSERDDLREVCESVEKECEDLQSQVHTLQQGYDRVNNTAKAWKNSST